jgi:hypothetical protein
MLVPALASSQQANVNLDYNPRENNENLIPFSALLNSSPVLPFHFAFCDPANLW